MCYKNATLALVSMGKKEETYVTVVNIFIYDENTEIINISGEET